MCSALRRDPLANKVKIPQNRLCGADSHASNRGGSITLSARKHQHGHEASLLVYAGGESAACVSIPLTHTVRRKFRHRSTFTLPVSGLEGELPETLSGRDDVLPPVLKNEPPRWTRFFSLGSEGSYEAARTEATRMFSTIQPGERLNDSSTGLEGERQAWAHKSPVSFCSSSSDTLPEKTITWGVCPSLKTPTRQFTSQLPRLGFQQRP